MTRRVGNIVVAYDEEPQQCDLCGKIAELRPYGPNGECICYACGQKDPETTDRMMAQVLFDISPPEKPKQ